MEYTVQDGSSDNGIAKNIVLLAEASIGGQDQNASLISPGDEMEEEVGAVAVNRNVKIIFIQRCTFL